jgi:hypothetical protein
MVILDDSGLLEPVERGRWRVISESTRYPTLGAKRNAVARQVDAHTDILVFWDDDDLYLPWALSATVDAMQRARSPWSRPGQFLLLTPDHKALWRCRTWAREDRQDKACQGGWGIDHNLFHSAGGYPDHLSVGEDKQLAIRLSDCLDRLGQVDVDPVAMGWPPWYVWGPWTNRHVSSPIEQYATFDGGVGLSPSGHLTVRVKPTPPEIDLDLPFLPAIGPRPFAGDWYEDAER